MRHAGVRAVDLIDVGARGGMPPRWARYGDLVRVLAVEADADEALRLGAGAIAGALSDRDGDCQLHVTESPGCSSLLEPNAVFLSEFPRPERLNVTRTVSVSTSTLDGLCRAAAPTFLKIDVQGAEGLVLSGAADTLARCVVGVEVETAFAPMYRDQATFGSVQATLAAAGFELVDLRHTYWRREVARRVPNTRGQIAFADALYMLSPARLRDQPDLAQAALLASLVYGLYDWIVAYSAALPENEPLKKAAALVRKTEKRWSAREFPGRYRLAIWLQRVSDSLFETSDLWAPAGTRLGGRPPVR